MKKNTSERLKDRLLSEREIIDDCWLLQGHSKNEYATVKFMGRTYKLNRVSAHLFNGFDLNSKDQILHRNFICKFKGCWNPEHLYIGDNGQNVSDSMAMGTHPSAIRNRQVRGINGHELTKENVYQSWPSMKRECRICKRERKRKYYQQNKTKQN